MNPCIARFLGSAHWITGAGRWYTPLCRSASASISAISLIHLPTTCEYTSAPLRATLKPSADGVNCDAMDLISTSYTLPVRSSRISRHRATGRSAWRSASATSTGRYVGEDVIAASTHLAAVSSGPSAETANPPARPIAVKDALVAAVVAMAGVCGREWHTWSARRCGCLLATTKLELVREI